MLKNLILFSFFSITAIQAQNIDLPTEFLQNKSTGGRNAIPDNVIGSPYENEEWKIGTLTISDEVYTREMRYNAYADEIEMKEKGETTVVLKRDYIKVEIANMAYIISDYITDSGNNKQGYFMLLNNGETKLLSRLTKDLIAAQQAASSYQSDKPARFVDEKTYFIKLDSKPAIMIKLKEKQILENLENNKELKAYIKSNKLKLKTEEEVIQLFNHYNNL